MKTSTFFKLSAMVLGGLTLSGTGYSQIKFTNANSVLHGQTGTLGSNSGNHSGNTVLVVDVDNNGLDDIAKLDENRYLRIEYQQGGGTFNIANSVFDIGSGNEDIWGASMADVDHNGYKDFLYAGWGNGARLIKLNNTGTGNLGITSLPSGNIASQNCNFMDVNNDGWEDIFVCNDVNESKIWVNSGTGTFPAEQGNAPYINFDVTPGTSAPNDESGNYGSVWTDFDNDGDVDLYIAHCRQGQPNGDLRRADVLFENNGSNVYTSTAASHGLFSYTQDWTSSFGDIDNDGDFDLLLTGHEAGNTNRLFINDGNGNFTPNAAQVSVSYGSTPQQSFMEDLDNDGWIDIIMSGTTEQVIHKNNGDGTFTLQSTNNLGFTGTWISFACGDLNHDGKIDIYSSYGSIYNNPSSTDDDIYWTNATDNNNNFLTLDLRGTSSTDGALGARAYIYGAWGVQTREVRASESYGTLNSYKLHFGLGTATAVDSVVIDWPATGSPSTHIVNPGINQFLVVTEGTCVSPSNTVTYSGSPVICSPGTLTLNAASGVGYTYLWSTGATTQSINVAAGGEYNVRVTAPGNSCVSWSPNIHVIVDPVETPSITAGGPTTFCPGGSVTLTSSETTGNTWSNSANTQSINVTTAGTYTVDYAGVCQSWTSNPITVTLLAAPAAPTTTDDVIAVPGTGTLTATGTTINWYTALTGGTLVGSGSPFVTPFVSTNTTYYAEDQVSYGGGSGTVGSTNIAGSSYSGNTINGYLKFNVLANSTLVSVDVSTELAGTRTIELRDNGGTVINSLNTNIPVGNSTITLNFPLTPGTDYQLGTNTTLNNTNFGYNSPRLVRENTTPTFPYTLAGAVDITTGNNGGSDVNAYYYFFNWQVTMDATDVCTSVRTPATVTVTSTAGIDNNEEATLLVYPNPASDFVNIEFSSVEQGEAILSIYDMLGKKVYDVNLGQINGKVVKTINTSTYAKGVYNVKLNINNHDHNTKVIVK
jgi:hypothetical protein